MKRTGMQWRLADGRLLVQVLCGEPRAGRDWPCEGLNIARDTDDVVRCLSCGAECPMFLVEDAR